MMTESDFDLLLAYLDDELDDNEVGSLVERLQAEPRLAEQLVLLAGEEGKIVEWAGATSGLRPLADSRRRASFGGAWLVASVVLVLVAAIGASVWFAKRDDVAPAPIAGVEEPAFDARLVKTTGCKWAEGRTPMADGAELDIGSVLELVEGVAEIEYASGVHVVIEGPVTFEVSLVDAGKLTAGQLSATVPNAAIGFTIHTPALDVVDRGTQFSVRIGEAGATQVHVFQGEVETQTRGPHEAPKVRKTLTATQAAQFNAKGRFGGWLDPDYEGFAGVGHHAYGVVSTDRAMRWLPQAPPVLEEGELQSDSDLFLFLERRDVLLERDLEITSFQRRGTQAHFSTEFVILPAGTRVDSYLVHFDPGGSTHSRLGGVRFERPVLGIIARGDQLRATDEILGASGTWYHCKNAAASGLDDGIDDLAKKTSPDVVAYKLESGLSFALHVQPGTLDQVRILVASGQP